MRFLTAVAVVCGLFFSNFLPVVAESSQLVWPKAFKPAFLNVNLVRNINLEKAYIRETINVVVQNIEKQPQRDYFLPFPSDVVPNIGGLEVRDKNGPEKGRLRLELSEIDPSSNTQFYVIHLPEPLAPSSQITLSISYYILSALHPLPKAIRQDDRQFLTYSFSAYALSAYTTVDQKTKIKFPSVNVPDYTVTSGLKSGSDPEKQGSTYTYGPYSNIAPRKFYPLNVRFAASYPVLVCSLLERDVEISHWGGNLAVEERYWLRNSGASLSDHFDRVSWMMKASPSSAPLRVLKYPMKPGSVDPYFTDDIGNVSTSNYRPGRSGREAHLELRPRYPVFGGWQYSFRVGWNNALSSFLRKSSSETFVLKVPFLEGPQNPEGIQYEKFVLRIILPEGSKNVRYEIIESVNNGLPNTVQIKSNISKHRTFMDTVGRTVLSLSVENLTDAARDSQLVVTYDFPFVETLRKPLTISSGLLAVFVTAWVVSKLDVSIRKR
ncbi:hypothetical protein Egran_03315 [Elaphomyces granulatus]|uniref:Dolichyl-diphosphooligosaccharide--protein glycosyltransferase subunit 1 n=1 Tax=Elaphomyces granulatus TaxID=519963 RepID=A0A232LXN0_9EURO|nr:hypothetical protein Egran_03315 [Elaphomyces granulatus]